MLFLATIEHDLGRDIVTISATSREDAWTNAEALALDPQEYRDGCVTDIRRCRED